MGCRQFRIKPAIPLTGNESAQVEASEPQVNIIQNTTDKSEVEQIVVFRNPLNKLITPLMVVSIIPDEPEQSTQVPPPIKSNGCHNTTNEQTAGKSGEPNPSPISPKNIPIPCEDVFRSPTMNSDMSYISEDHSITISSNQSDVSYSIYRPATSSAANSQIRAYGDAAIKRYMSAGPNRLTNQGSTHHGNWSEPDESYSLRDSIVTTISADSEGSVVDVPRSLKTVFVHPKISNRQQKPVANDTSSDSDESELHHVKGTNSTRDDIKVMRECLEIKLRVASTKLSNPDFQSRGVISETTSEADEK